MDFRMDFEREKAIESEIKEQDNISFILLNTIFKLEKTIQTTITKDDIKDLKSSIDNLASNIQFVIQQNQLIININSNFVSKNDDSETCSNNSIEILSRDQFQLESLFQTKQKSKPKRKRPINNLHPPVKVHIKEEPK